MSRVILTLACVCATFTSVAHAELRMPAIFSDHMVVQREVALPVWGWTDAGTDIRVEFLGQSKSTRSGADGKWSVTLEPVKPPADGKPVQLSIVTPDETLAIADVLVGEVWLGSGQSNMAMTVNRCRDFEKEQAAANFPNLRMFTEGSTAMPEAQTIGRGRWVICSPESVGGFSGTLYFFGRELHTTLQVPVGLINSSVGGTPIESWISPEAQAAEPKLKDGFETARRAFQNVDEAKLLAQYETQLASHRERAAKLKAAGKPVPRAPLNPIVARQRRGGPGHLFNGKIAPLIPFGLRGAVWYQGEANAGHPDLYAVQLPTLILDWRARWGNDFPFGFVQLPNFHEERGRTWPEMRAAMQTTLSVPKTGMAVTIDIGDVDDIHPTNKQDVGRRLAAWALGTTYGLAGETSGPVLKSKAVQGHAVVLTFDHADDSLNLSGKADTAFEIAGADKVFKPAESRIEKNTVFLTNAEVPKPRFVRYAWAASPQGFLTNAEGLVAAPFQVAVED